MEGEEPEGKKGKKDKDPALPKGSRSAYTFFNEEVSTFSPLSQLTVTTVSGLREGRATRGNLRRALEAIWREMEDSICSRKGEV